MRKSGRDETSAGARIDRREFLRRGGMAGIGLGLFPLAPAHAATAAPEPGIQRYVPLGRTGLEISDIGFGSASLSGDERLIHHALDRGINYFDTAESYTDGEAERTLGRALKGRRDRVFLTSKVGARPHHSRQDIEEALNGSLRRLQTDRVDVYLNHAVNSVERVANPEWGEFVERAKQAGKIRFSGMSGHGGRLIECIEYALDHEILDVLLSAYNFAQDPGFYRSLQGAINNATRDLDWVATLPEIPRTLARAKRSGVGVIAMKTLRGARRNDLRPYETGDATFAQAAFRWVLANPDVDALIVTMKNTATVDEYLMASGWRHPRRADLPLLARYEQKNGASQCHYGCTACSASCPHDVPISEVLRTRMYAEDYGEMEQAHREYAQLGAGAAACVDCAERSCLDACPYGLEIAKLTARTHRSLASGV